jgi:hypothetical protein
MGVYPFVAKALFPKGRGVEEGRGLERKEVSPKRLQVRGNLK